MMLSCECGEISGDPGERYYFPPDDFTKLDTTKRKRCSSCRELLNIGSEVLKFSWKRIPWTDIEEQITGCEVPMAPTYMCEKCGEIYLNLTAVGYCLNPDSNMEEYLKDYWELTGFEPMQKATHARGK